MKNFEKRQNKKILKISKPKDFENIKIERL